MNVRVSVVTVSYNAESIIEKTIQSVLDQSYDNLEYIVIDGGSTDGTVDIIKKYRDRLAFWTSEPDGGVYDAMNKGVGRATGEWVNFMNCGDSFYGNRVVENIFGNGVNASDVIYGDTCVTDSFGEYVPKPRGLDSFKRLVMPFSHQCSFVRADLMRKRPFDLKYRYCADFDFFYRLWRENVKFKYMPLVVCRYDIRIGSMSYDNAVSVYRECLDIVEDRSLGNYFRLTLLLLRCGAKKIALLLFPGIKKWFVERNGDIKWKSW